MRVERVYVRHFKAFNFDYLRKFSSEAKPDPWDTIEDTWQPYVRVPLEPSLTTIVGANESGKSQLLDAIRIAVTGEGIDRGDFCRYSSYFEVEEERRRKPDFGVQLGNLTPEQSSAVAEVVGDGVAPPTRFWLFRDNGETVVYLGPNQDAFVLKPSQASKLLEVLPRVVTIRPDVPLPESVPMRYLLGYPRDRRLNRTALAQLVDLIEANEGWLANAQSLAGAAPSVLSAVGGAAALREESERIATSYALAKALLFDIARVAPDAISDLRTAIQGEREGFASAIVSEINAALEKRLNLRRWWSQDRDSISSCPLTRKISS